MGNNQLNITMKKESLKHSKQKEISEELANTRLEDIQNLTYLYKG